MEIGRHRTRIAEMQHLGLKGLTMLPICITP
jgi:hypothetical protein